jgi:hypothetical protein
LLQQQHWHALHPLLVTYKHSTAKQSNAVLANLLTQQQHHLLVVLPLQERLGSSHLLNFLQTAAATATAACDTHS